MDYHHVIEAAGVVSLGLVAYSYLVRWFEAGPPTRRRWRPVATGLTFGAVAIVLMISRIHVGDDRFVDARVIPIALVALVEGGPAGALAAAGAVRVWARRDGGVGLRHSFALSSQGAAMLAPVWMPVLFLNVVGIGLVARLFTEVVAAHAAEASRRETAQLRAVNALAHAAAHEINNPLMAVLGGRALVSRSVAAETDQAKWIGTAREGAERIRDIVRRMNHITTIEEAPRQGALPPMLDITKSSASS